MALRLEEYKYIINARDKEIDVLQKSVSEANAYRSALEAQLMELHDLKDGISAMKQLADTAAYSKDGNGAAQDYQSKISQDAIQLREENTHLKMQLSDLEEELSEMRSMQALYIQQNSRISKLESQLKIAEDAKNNSFER